MAAITRPKTSRLKFSELRVIDDITFWDIVNLPTFVPRGDEMFHMVQGGDRIDLLSQFYYGVPSLWWVIAWANDIESIPGGLNDGAVIIIPGLDYIHNVLLR